MHAVHRTILTFDVEGFGDQHRYGVHQMAVRKGLYRALEKSFAISGIPWADCHREDRGDGVFVLAPPHVAKALFVEPLPHYLAGALRRHNAVHSAQARIRLRMALHAGEVCLDRYGATGVPVNLAFRLLEAGELKSALDRGSGVLALIVSAWFFDEVVRDNPAIDPACYRKVEVSVKETSATAWIYVPGWPRPVAMPHQLPAATYLVGRAVELDQLNAALNPGESVPVCVVTGTAGVGKTALALGWAHQIADRFPDGQLHANLNGFGDQAPTEPGEVLHGFLQALGVDPSAIPATLTAKAALYRSLTAGRRMLVVLDNAHGPQQIRPLIPGAATSTVIVTSRNRLTGLSAEFDLRHLTLGLLGTGEALQILAHQSGQERIDAEPQAAAALAELCAGLPLALTITGARAGARPRLRLQELAQELSSERTRLDRLTLDDIGLDLRSVLSWSYQQLPRQAARLFRLLGLHPGRDIDIHAAAALTGTSRPATRQSIDRLLAAHLLSEDPPGRFAMHDLLRVYAQELANDESEPHAALARLSDCYLSTADRADRFITPHRYRVPLDIRKDADAGPVIDSYGAALDWLTAEAANLVTLCRIGEDGFESRCWQLAYTLRGFFFLAKRWDAWIQTHELALQACLRSGDPLGEAITRNNLGRALLECGRQKEAGAHYEAARRLFEQLGDRHGVSNAVANQATILRRQGRFDEALRFNRQALAYYRQAGAQRNTAITLRSMALAELGLGRLPGAERHAKEAVDIFVALDLHLEAAKGFNTLGLIHQRRGYTAQAESAYRRAIEVSRRCSSLYEEARARHRLGSLAAARGSHDEAQRQWSHALSLYQALRASKADHVAADLAALDPS